jgi:hypothetical protein
MGQLTDAQAMADEGRRAKQLSPERFRQDWATTWLRPAQSELIGAPWGNLHR